MKKMIVKELQNLLVKVSLNSVGRSFPAGVYERKIPDEVLKIRNAKSK